MPKKASTPVKASRKVAVEEDEDEEEEEVVVVAPAKKTTASVPKSAKNGKATNGKVATVAKRSTTSDDSTLYTPNANSMRDFVLRAMSKGGSATQIKSRAAKLAEKKGVEGLSDPKAYKNFDVAYYAKFLKGKGYDVDIDEEGDNYTLNA